MYSQKINHDFLNNQFSSKMPNLVQAFYCEDLWFVFGLCENIVNTSNAQIPALQCVLSQPCHLFIAAAKKGTIGKSKEELTLEKRRELEKRLQDVSGQLNSVKKPTKPKGELPHHQLTYSTHVYIVLLLRCKKQFIYCHVFNKYCTR